MRKTPRGQRSVYAVKHGGRDALGSLPAVGTLLGVVAALAIAVVAIVVWIGGPLAAKDLEAEPEGSDKQVLQSYEDLPLTFVENRGQTDERVRYHAQGPGYAFYFTTEEVMLSLAQGADAAAGKDPSSAEGVALALRFVGANPDAVVEGEDRVPGEVNYLRGDDPEHWQTELPGYTSVVYRELWPGIDMVLHGQDGQLKYEFRLRPGAQPSDIQLAYAGADGLTLDETGGLLIETPLGKLQDSPPVTYQEIDGERVPVESRYVLDKEGGGEPGYGFAVGSYQPDHDLVIDPGVEYSTFLGGSSHEDGNGITVDAEGNAYIVGTTQSTNFPTTTGAFDRSFAGGITDVFISKLNATGSALVYSTYLGGTPTALPAGGSDNLEFGRAIAVDGNGNAYVTGQTSSSDFPTTSGAFDRTLSVSTNNAIDGFVTKLNATGSGLVYSTFLGGASPDDGRSVAIDGSGNAYIAGETDSNDFPTTEGAYQTAKGGGRDAFVTKLNATGSSLAYSTYLGGALDNELSNRVRVDGNGSAYIAGATRSTDFPTTAGVYQPTHSGGATTADLFEAFVTKLSPNGSSLAYSTFLGGTRVDRADGLALDGNGNAYVSGGTTSTDFPTTAGALDTTHNGGGDGFAAKLNATGSDLAYSTFLGGSGGEGAPAIALGAQNSAWLTGGTSSADFPTTADGFDTQFDGGSTDTYVANLNADGSALTYGTFLGGANSENGFDVAADSASNAYVTGRTFSADFPATTGALDRTFDGDPSIFWGDAFVTKFGADETAPPPPDSDPAALSSLSLDPTTVTGGESSTGTVTLDSAAPDGGASITLSSSNTSAATVPASVNVPAGQTSATFTVSTNSVSSDTSSTISASYEGVTQTASLAVNAAPAASRTTTEFSGEIDRRETLSHTVLVGASGPVDLTLDWSGSRSNLTLRVLDPSGNVVFSASGSAKPKTGTFSAAGAGDYRFEITNTSRRDTNYTLSVTHPVASSTEEPAPDPEPEPATLSSLGLSPLSVTGGESSTGTVTLDSAAPAGGASVALSSSNTAAATVPASVNVPEGSTSRTFTVSTSSVSSDTSSTISASHGGVTRTASLAVNAPAPEPDPAALSSLSLDPTTVTGGESSTGTVTFDSAAPEEGASVTLSSSDTATASVPPSVTVPAGQTSATFTVSTSSVSSDSSSTISASYGGLSRTATLTVNAPAADPDPVTLAALDLNPTTVTGGESSTGTVTLDSAAPEGGASVALDSSNTATATVPASVTVPAGQTSATFTVSTSSVDSDSSSAISASYSGVTRSVILTVNAPAASSTTTNFSGEIDDNQTLRHTVLVGASGPVDLNLNWDESRVNLRLRVLDASGNVVFSDSSTDRPKTGTFSAEAAGDYRFEIINATGRNADYTLAVTHP